MKVKEYFSDRKRWSQGIGARNQDGLPALGTDRVTSMCLWVAIISRFEGDRVEAIRNVTSYIQKNYGYDNIAKFNDAVEYETMMEVVERFKL